MFAQLPVPAPSRPRRPVYTTGGTMPLPTASDVLEQTLLARAKSATDVTVMEHASHVLQVARWLTGRLPGMAPRERNLICLAAALHDMGKAVTEPTGKRWAHSRESADLVPIILGDSAFRQILADAGLDVNLTEAERLQVQALCREHHGYHAATVFANPGAPFVTVADAIASALVEGYHGHLRAMLANRYPGLQATLLAALGRAPWLDAELHELELPHEEIGDLLLAETLLERCVAALPAHRLELVMRGTGRLWVAGALEDVEALLATRIAARDLLDVPALDRIYGRGSIVRAPQAEPAVLSYFFANPRTACRIIQDTMIRRKAVTRALLEAEGLSFAQLTSGVDAETLADPAALGALLYDAIRRWAVRRSRVATKLLPRTHAEWLSRSAGVCDAARKSIVADIRARSPKRAKAAQEILQLIGRGTTCRSVSNAVHKRQEILRGLDEARVAFTLAEVAWVDGTPVPTHADGTPILEREHEDLLPTRPTARKTAARKARKTAPPPCAICDLRPASVASSAMLAGATFGDSKWASQGRRTTTETCAWCHTVGVVTLPLVTLRMLGRARKVRELNYILVESAFSRDRLATVLQEIGALDAASARDAVQPASAAAPLTAADEALFLAVQGHVPERVTPTGVAGLSGSLPVRQAAGFLVPGATPLASRALFVLPSATLFGQHETQDMNSAVLEMVALGLVATLRTHLGPARFRLRATSSKAAIAFDTATLDPARCTTAQIALAIAEYRRRTCIHPAIHQQPHTLDLDFVLALTERPRDAVSRLIREIMQTTPTLKGAQKKILVLTTLVERLTAGADDPITTLLRATMHDLMRAGVVSETDTPYQRDPHTPGGVRFKRNRELCGAFHPFWDVVDTASLERWMRHAQTVARKRGAPEGRDQRVALVRQATERIWKASKTLGLPLNELRAQLCAQMYLAVFATSLERRTRRATVQATPSLPLADPLGLVSAAASQSGALA